MLKTTDAGRAVRGPMFRLAHSMRDAALLVGGGLARTPKLWRRLSDFSLLMAIAGSLVLAVNHTTGAAPKPWYYMSGGYGGGGYGGGYGNPNLDSDGDGVVDSMDACPLAAGSPFCAGCPSAMCSEPGPLEDVGPEWALNCTTPPYGQTDYFSAQPFGYGLPLAEGPVTFSLQIRPGNGNTAFVTIDRPYGDPAGGSLFSTQAKAAEGCQDVARSFELSAAEFNAFRTTSGIFPVRVSHALWDCSGACNPRVQLTVSLTGRILPSPSGNPDGDGFANLNDRCPLAYGECDGCPPEQSPDSDRDGERDCFDNDDDNDGIPDWSDRCPLVAVAYGESDCFGCPPALCESQPVALDLGRQGLPCQQPGYGEPSQSYSYFALPPGSPVAESEVQLTVALNAGRTSNGSQLASSTIYDAWWWNSLGTAVSSLECVEQDNVIKLDASQFNWIRSSSSAFQVYTSNRSDCGDCTPTVGLRMSYIGYGEPMPESDGDSDGWPLSRDRCPLEEGDCQGCPCTDTDGDGEPDAFDVDDDNDGVADESDNCPLTANPSQSDADGNGLGDACDPDWADCNLNGIADASDLASGLSADCNGNGVPDECEDGSVRRSTGDMGGVYTSPSPREATGQLSNLPVAEGTVVLTIRAVADLDANNESLTLFLADPKNPIAVLFGPNSPACGQLNSAQLSFSAEEWNAIRDLPGGDSITATLQPSFAVSATCDGNGTGPIEGYTEVIVEYLDAVPDCNNNGTWDACEPDTDGDGTIDDCDGCPNDPTKQAPGVCGCNTADTDSDVDGAADCIDTDDDNDGVTDDADAFPLDPIESADTDMDGQGNNADLDDDNDGIADVNDAFPLDASESADADGDGTGDNGDLDDDNDGTDDSVDGCPLDGSKQEPGQCGCGTPDTDTDNDGTADCLESPFGSVGGWGYNEYGQLNVPVGLPVAKQISSGYQHTLALLTDGSVAAWGFNQLGQCDVPAGLSGVLSISGGRDHSLALKQDGSVVAWGSQVFGQSTVPAGLTNVARIAAGGDHSLALRHDGSIVAWGRNDLGQCVAPFDSAPFLDVAGGYSHSMAIRSDGTVVCWGDNSNGQCTVPAGLANVVAIAAGGSHSIALTSAGTVVCWGPDNPTTDVPAGLAGVTQIAAGTGHSVALKADGTVVCWGYNFENQCTVPADVQICLQVAAGNSHTIVLQADCNHDAVADYLQLGGNDCNQDSILDACQLESGLIEDCNDNGLADQCEKAESIDFATGAIGPIGAGSAVTWTLPAAPLASTDVILSGSVRGDFDSPFESLTFKFDNVLTTVVVVNTGINTQCRETTFSLVIPAATFNAARQADGTVAARFEASVAVDPQACPGGTWIDVTATYITSTAADCNANGLIDSCELAAGLGTDQNGNGIPDDCENPATACPADLDRNGVVEGRDLAILLGAWGSGSAAQDITGDGLIDGSDLATVLGAWGSCED